MANDQRKVVYGQSDTLLATDDAGETIADLRAEVVNTIINQFVPPESLEEQWDRLHPICSISLNFPKPTTASLRR